MEREQLAKSMALVFENSEEVKICQYHLDKIEPFEQAALGSNGLLNIDDIGKAEAYEVRINKAKEDLNKAQERYDFAAKRFIENLPNAIVKLLRDDNQVLHAAWVNQDSLGLKFGPFAAYYKDGKLAIDKFDSHDDLKAAFNK